MLWVRSKAGPEEVKLGAFEAVHACDVQVAPQANRHAPDHAGQLAVDG